MSEKGDLAALSEFDWGQPDADMQSDRESDDNTSSREETKSEKIDDKLLSDRNDMVNEDHDAAAPIPADDQDGAAPKSAEATSPTDTDATGGADAQETGDDLETQVDATPQPSEPSPIPGFLDLTKPDDEVETGGDGSQHYGNGKRPPPYSFA
jgi:hypothetical protein